MSSRFDYVQFDAQSIEDLAEIKCLFQDVEEEICERIPESRARSLALTRLEEAYMWTGKAIREEQLEREGGFHGLGQGAPQEPEKPADEHPDTVADPVSPGPAGDAT